MSRSRRVPSRRCRAGRRSIDDALLLADDAAAPWELMNREIDRFTDDIGA
jgi:hypothetical protein